MSSLVARLGRAWYPGFQRNWDERRVANAGGIPYENDRFDVVFSDNVLEHLAEPLAVFDCGCESRPLCQWRRAGYVRVQQGPAVAFLDVAPIGADYSSGHAHADTLTFELSLDL